MIEAPQVEADSLKDSTTTRKRKLVKTTTTDLYVSDIGFHHCKALLDTYWGGVSVSIGIVLYRIYVLTASAALVSCESISCLGGF